MATVDHASQSEPRRVASAAVEEDAPRRAGLAAKGTPADYPVLLRLPDVSSLAAHASESPRSSLKIDSALERVGSGGATPTRGQFVDRQGAFDPGPNEAAFAYAALLAASPTLSNSASSNSTSSAAGSPSSHPHAPTRQTTGGNPAGGHVEQALQGPAGTILRQPFAQPSRPVTNHSISNRDDAVRKFKYAPVRPQAARIDFPANSAPGHRRLARALCWTRRVPPTVVLGLLICFGALLIGMLWRNGAAPESSGVSPAAREQLPPAAPGEVVDQSTSASNVATVPQVPAATQSKSKTKPKAGDSLGESVAKKPFASEASPRAPASTPQASVRERPADAQPGDLASQPSDESDLPAPRITGIRPLPPVPAWEAVPDSGFPVEGTRPHFVDNPHAGSQNPIYQARRPGAEFQGTISKPDATPNHERY